VPETAGGPNPSLTKNGSSHTRWTLKTGKLPFAMRKPYLRLE